MWRKSNNNNKLHASVEMKSSVCEHSSSSDHVNCVNNKHYRVLSFILQLPLRFQQWMNGMLWRCEKTRTNTFNYFSTFSVSVECVNVASLLSFLSIFSFLWVFFFLCFARFADALGCSCTRRYCLINELKLKRICACRWRCRRRRHLAMRENDFCRPPTHVECMRKESSWHMEKR